MADKPLDVIKEETTRQAIVLLFSVAGAVVTLFVVRARDDAVLRSTMKMQFALSAKRFCQHRADRWQDWADKAATLYNREKA